MRTIGVIPARFESSRFPGKPLADILGRPMIWWVYQQCLKVEELDRVIVATDDLRIGEACDGYGMDWLMTSRDCATGSDRVAEAAEKIEGDLFVNIQGDEPVIPPQMIQEVIGIFSDESVCFGTLKTRIQDMEEIQAASTVKVVTDRLGDALYFSRSPIPSNIKDGFRAEVFRHVGIYAYKREFLLKFHAMPQTELELGEGIEPLRAMENGYRVRVAETRHSSIGVDYPEHIARVTRYLADRGAL